MSTAYVAPDPSIAELVDLNQKESMQQSRRLADAPADVLRAVARDTTESDLARGNAIMFLLMRRDPQMAEILLELFDDPNQDLWRSTARSYRPDDPRVKERLYRFLDDSRERNWSEAAVVLARYRDESLLPRLKTWLIGDDPGRRNVAIECLKTLGTPECCQLLGDFWERQEGDRESFLVVAAALLSLGDPRGLNVLEATARDAIGDFSVFAATAIFEHDRRRGLDLWLAIAQAGDLAALQSLVNQIWNFERLPGAFTTDGLIEARKWIESQLALA